MSDTPQCTTLHSFNGIEKVTWNDSHRIESDKNPDAISSSVHL